MSEQEEQLEAYQKIESLLLAAGFFRVRIAALSKFDKVVGGLAWAIANCGTSADVNDVVFVENSSLRQKVRIADTILRALQKMKCPFPLASQHIQGSNFIELFKPIQWLVKKVLENRSETGDYMRRFAESQFDKFNALPEDVLRERSLKPASEYAKHVVERYKPKRGYRPTISLRERPEDEQATSVLLEFGHRYRLSKASSGSAEEQERLARMAAEEAERLNEMMSSLAQVSGKGIASSIMGSMFGDTSDMEAVDDSAERLAELKRKQAESREAAFVNKRAALMQRIAALKAEAEAAAAELAAAEERNAEGATRLQAKVEYNANVVAETQKLLDLETPENAHIVAQLRKLYSLVDNLELQHTFFRSSCAAQKAELEATIARIKAEGPNSAVAQRLAQLQSAEAAEQHKLDRLRAAYAKKIRDIALVERKIDELPSRAELNQYQRRFVELYELVASKHIETKRFYATFNTLTSVHEYLDKEVEYVESIAESYRAVFKVKKPKSKAKAQFVAHVEELANSLGSILERAKDQAANEKANRDGLNALYLKQVDIERKYFQAVKAFEKECGKNELLMTQLVAEAEA
ncbi:coiled-coil domain containing 93 [Thecamonas trahens ATCC 50062]|uniref:Coiled-coil domain containing 93 n=1 Tax=Thecamonas trahens ATCC 50062 TaxID=461836 RepID=A0A0L0DA24_THETB|nr:coiled-coil domain containing 93 [Thecamonas trahens ATCC 50062]KNC48946.1 coiled-coil domain containing 93 [Thecamonas trahens ATCC 50062]|eukprot:XP_013758363.1 coiled-coil domain containing 93 [Thecamonas trahens ATCC 50062]